jgi:hypothetical protein
MGSVVRPVALREQYLKGLAYQFLAGITKEALELPIDLCDAPCLIDEDQGIR